MPIASLDGYPYNELYEGGKSHWPSWSPKVEEKKLPRCTMSFQECFDIPGIDNGTARASDVFTNIAFVHPKCGDCGTYLTVSDLSYLLCSRDNLLAIMALVKASGPVGQSAFLPTSERVFSAIPDSTPDPALAIPHLPLVPDWADGDFSLRGVLDTSRDTSVRTWSMELMQRYRYVIGDTPALFERITSARAAKSVLDRIDTYKDTALLCINDDVSWGDEEVAQIMKEWQDRKWSRRSAWERS